MDKTRTRYVLGFAFSKDLDEVVLIQKRKPVWQAGKWNGVGGKVEQGETSLEAMVREFKEETTVETNQYEWTQFAVMSSTDWTIDVFYAVGEKFYDARTNTPERVTMLPINYVFSTLETISNLAWLIPMAINAAKDMYFYVATIGYYNSYFGERPNGLERNTVNDSNESANE